MSNTLNLAFFGSSKFVVPILEDIYSNCGKPVMDIYLQQLNYLASNHKEFKAIYPENLLSLKPTTLEPFFQKIITLDLVVSQPDRLNRNKIQTNPVSVFARNSNLQLFTPEKLNLELAEFTNLVPNLDLAFVASFGQIISTKILESAKYGFLNWHPSLLPKYRGATPMQETLKNGEKISGLSWLEVTKKMDAGDVYLQFQKTLAKEINFTGLAQEMGALGKNTWAVALVFKILFPQLALVQNETETTFTKILTKDDKSVDPKNQSAKDILNHYRAYQVFPGTAFIDDYFKSTVTITEACLFTEQVADFQRIYENETWLQLKANGQNRVLLKCQGSSIFEVKRIRLETGKQIDFKGFNFK